MRFKMLFLCLFFCADALAQTLNEEENLLESMTDRVDEDYDFSELADRLLQYRQNPLNLNSATQNQLAELFILSAQQIASLFDYIHETGPLLSAEELQAVDHFDLATIKKLLPYISIKPAPEKFTAQQIFSAGKNDLMLRYGQILQKPLGYTRREGSRYLGGPQRYLFRYRFNFLNRLLLSLNAEKDAGEPFFSAQNKQGFDFYSGSLAWSPQHSAIKKVVLGDYALQFGQGLSMYTGLSFGKSADISMIPKAGRGLAPYTSTNESLFFRGLSASIGTHGLNITPFVSYRKVDASIAPKTGLAGSLQQSGYHRTLTELKNKGALAMLVAGADLNYSRGALNIGGHFYHAKTDKLLATGQHIYDQFDFSGNRLTNGSIYGSMSMGNTYFFAEGAKSLHGGTAFLAGSISSLTDKISLSLLARNYGRDYRSMFNQAMSEGSYAANERGLYSGIYIRPNQRWQMMAYTDVFRFPWLRYRVDAPSTGYELFTQTTFSPDKRSTFYIRYRYETKQQNDDSVLMYHTVPNVIRQNIRADAAFHLYRGFSLRYRAEGVFYEKESDHQHGILIYQDLFYMPYRQKTLSASLRVAWFKTDSYESRIYAFENDVLYSYAIPVYFGHGVRTYLNAHLGLKHGVDVWARYALFAYQGQTSVGSGLDEISGNRKSDLKIQLRLQF